MKSPETEPWKPERGRQETHSRRTVEKACSQVGRGLGELQKCLEVWVKVSPWRTALQVLGVSLCHVKYGVASPLDRKKSRTRSETEISPWAGRVLQAGMLLKPSELEPEFCGPNKPHGATSPYEPIKRAILIEKSKKDALMCPHWKEGQTDAMTPPSAIHCPVGPWDIIRLSV